MIDNRAKATKEDVEEFETALRSEFPTKTPTVLDEKNLHEDIGNFEQGPDESLRFYCGRAQELLRKSYCRDDTSDGSSPLAPIEMVVLSGIITAFFKGNP